MNLLNPSTHYQTFSQYQWAKHNLIYAKFYFTFKI